jgi:thiamine phosphate synthase YjbQ (UPF0047 family)
MEMFALLSLLVSLVLTPSAAFSGANFHRRDVGLTTGSRTRVRSLQMGLEFMTHYEEIQLGTDHGMSVFDITDQIEAIVAKSSCKEGTVTVLSKHSTVSVSINEMEGRLVDDIRQYFLSLAPPHRPYLHNDIDYRVGPSDWPGGDEAWREFRRTQPVNTHSHLIAMMLGTSECIPISDGAMKKGKYQSILVVDVDGPKSRGIAVQITGGK